MSVRLEADCLYSKWGFEDGDLLFNALYDMGLYGVDDSEVLAYCVTTYLAPLLPAGVTLERIITHHNPIRASDWVYKRVPAWAYGIHVDITEEQIREAVDKVTAAK